MKKLVMLATVAALPLALAACGEKATNATAGSTEQAQATAEATASNDQGSNDQGSNDQGSNDQGGKEQ